jgi:glycosyltransferase involved in cell wall biosynthesis
MRIAMTVDPYLPVPPQLYGGIERIVDFLVRGLVERRHQVTLFAHPQSCTSGTHIPYGKPPHVGWFSRLAELWQVGFQLWRRRNEFDIVHSFGRLAALLPILPLRTLPKIQSYQRTIAWAGVKRATRLAGPSLHFTACSSSLYQGRLRQRGCVGQWHTIFNGVDVAKYACVPVVRPDAPLVFLGRLEMIKGPHHAIAIAKRCGRQLILAGNRQEGADSYFEQHIEPHIDGTRIRYIGPVNDEQKNTLLGGAAALLMPIEWKEPFGIVMAEAMACGTPVIGFSQGSVPEIIRDGSNGFLCRTVDEAAAAVARIDTIDRSQVRADCEIRFSKTVVVGAYERLYQELVRPR